ncbi:MAG: ATP-binding protein [Bacteroidetes bacterium]|nr:MAG: ATP-binding protein [Bacteroidota bacterium]
MLPPIFIKTMKLKKIQLKKFKRFTDITLLDIPESAKLIILIGPNGSGKTSLFEAFKQWSGRYGGLGYVSDISYIAKDEPDFNNIWSQNIKIEFHGANPDDSISKKRAFYIRSAYRNEADFTVRGLNLVGSALDSPRINTLIDNDESVSDNYQRIVSHSKAKVFSGDSDAETGKQIREALIGKIRESMIRVFGDLILTGPGDPLKNGAFYFEKGTTKDFHFKNLSGGEKAAFDLILDIITKRIDFNDTVYCIDEPDTHLHTKLQAKILEELYSLIPDNCQLVISTHSIGMMRKAVDMQKQYPDKVCFFDFHDKNPDEVLELKPAKVTRELWRQTLSIALDDLSELVSPKRIIVCEGRPANLSGKNIEFDAQILRKIFNEYYSDTDFVSVGNEKDVRSERLELITTLRSLNIGIEFVKIIDRDDRSQGEIDELLKTEGVRVLKKRDIESYLLDDEIIEKLCKEVGREDAIPDCIKIKADSLAESISRGNPTDDIKSAAGKIYVELKKRLFLSQCGNSTETFLRDTIAPLLTKDTKSYCELESEIFKEK